jgi:integrase
MPANAASGPEHVRKYQFYLVQQRELQPRTIRIQMSALRFLFVKTLQLNLCRDDLPLPKAPWRLPTILSQAEVARLIDSPANIRHRIILMFPYGTGVRMFRDIDRPFSAGWLRSRKPLAPCDSLSPAYGSSRPACRFSRDRSVLLLQDVRDRHP